MVIIAVTGWGHDDDRQKSKAAGFDGHLVKPVQPSTAPAAAGQTTDSQDVS
jgi:CheY-like chemotaxis protein